jgi:hypothetical protein
MLAGAGMLVEAAQQQQQQQQQQQLVALTPPQLGACGQARGGGASAPAHAAPHILAPCCGQLFVF